MPTCKICGEETIESGEYEDPEICDHCLKAKNLKSSVKTMSFGCVFLPCTVFFLFFFLGIVYSLASDFAYFFPRLWPVYIACIICAIPGAVLIIYLIRNRVRKKRFPLLVEVQNNLI